MASYGDYAARASLSETMLSISPLRTEIAESIMKQRSVANAGASFKPAAEKQYFPATDYLKVTADGTIVFRSSRHGQIIVLEPSFRADAVTWRCVGSKPEKNIPADCR
jgi:hypothetical protein